MTTLPQRPAILQRLLASYRIYGERFLVSDWNMLEIKEREAVDAWLVSISHPLAYQPGSAENRMLCLVKELSHE